MDVAFTMFLVACAMNPATASSTTLREGELDIGTCEQMEKKDACCCDCCLLASAARAIYVSGCFDACVLTRAPCTSGEVHSPYQNFKPPRRYLFQKGVHPVPSPNPSFLLRLLPPEERRGP